MALRPLPDKEERRPGTVAAQDTQQLWSRCGIGPVVDGESHVVLTPIVEKTVRGGPAPTLIAESAGAALLAVGSHGRDGFEGLVLGSVSHAVLHHAHSPVAVARP